MRAHAGGRKNAGAWMREEWRAVRNGNVVRDARMNGGEASPITHTADCHLAHAQETLLRSQPNTQKAKCSKKNCPRSQRRKQVCLMDMFCPTCLQTRKGGAVSSQRQEVSSKMH